MSLAEKAVQLDLNSIITGSTPPGDHMDASTTVTQHIQTQSLSKTNKSTKPVPDCAICSYTCVGASTSLHCCICWAPTPAPNL
ncbi:hypothetical protein E2C01_049243 [Portunus trituberculatus]|uniref:Uncharacterized protein n=1 Tax=Portunus trituberculatus TaxID=210409 RepID=A0A5B7G5N9_PORTR|nr:hypothetical protein [Portunus trituberculatus]